MADDPMLGLFDSDPTSFLDELTSANPNSMASQSRSMPMAGGSGSMMGMAGMQQHPGQREGFMGSMQGPGQQSYSPMSAMGATPSQYNTMSSQSSMLPQQYSNMTGYSQYGANSKLHHMNSSMVGSAGQQETFMGQSPPQQVQQQFASPPPTSPRMQRAPVPGYQSYGMHGGPRLPSPAQQQMAIPQQNSSWNQNTNTGQMSYLQQRQQQQQGLMGRNVPQMPNYLSQQQQQHDYGMSNSQSLASRLSHFPDPSNPVSQMGSGVMQGMGSPSGNMPARLSHIPMSSPNSMNMLHSRPTGSQQQYPNTSQPNINSYNSQAISHMPADYMQKAGQVVNSGGTSASAAGASKLQHFGFQTSPQNPGRNDAPPLTHYPNQSQNSPLGQYQNFPSAGAGARGPTPSPRPTPPPPSHTPTEMMTSPQGSVQQTGMQPFAGSNQSAVNPFQTRMPSAPSPGSTMGMAGNPRQPSNMNPYQNVGFGSNSNMPLGVSTTMANSSMGVSQISPSYMGQPGSGQMDINVEIQQLQQQVKQLYSMPHTQQSQKTMLELQERMRMLKAQQQQQILQIQQKQRQQQQHQMVMMQQQQQSSQMGSVQSPGMVSQPMHSPLSQPQISPTSPRKQATSQPGLQSMGSPVPITTLTTSPSPHRSQPTGPGNQPQVPAPTSSSTLPQPLSTSGLSSIANLSSPMASLVQLTDQQQLPTQQPFTQIHQQTSPVLQQQLPAQPEQRSPNLALAANTPSAAVKPEPQPAFDLPKSGQQPVLQTSTPQQSPMQTSPGSMGMPMSQIQPLQDMPGLPFHPQLQLHQPLDSQTEEEKMALGSLNVSAEDSSINVTANQSPLKSEEPSPEKKKKKRAKKKPVELGPDGQPIPKTPKTKTPKGPRKKKVKNPDNADQIIAEVMAQAPSIAPVEEETPIPELHIPESSEPNLPTLVSEITEGTTAEDTDTINVTDISGTEPLEIDTEAEAVTPTPKKKKVKKDSVNKDKKEKKEKKPKTPKPRPSKKKPPATLLKKKKKKGPGGIGGGSDISDLDATPPPSPQTEEESGIQKRRSARNTGSKRKKYLDELELNLSEEEHPEGDGVNPDGGPATMRSVQFFVDNPNEEDAVVVEKILGMRLRKRDKDDVPATEEGEPDPEEEEEEFYVKYKNFSYLHCEWRTIKELERDKRIQMKIKRYRMKRLAQNNYFAELDDEELFNPDYVEVDRVLDVSVTTDPVTEEEVTHFLVKWRSLAYDESTWELQQDVDPNKVEIFYKFKDPAPEDEREFKPRPSKAEEWTKLDESRKYKNENNLREYQLEGLNWLTFSWYNGRNCILADEMGLGKTIQSLTFSHEMFIYGIKGPFLVVAPLSTIANWQREYETWTDMNVITYHGSTPSRIMLQEYEMFFKDEKGERIPDIYKFHVLITTYEIIIADYDVLSQIDWRVAIIDEAHRLKNRNCQLLERLKLFDVEHRVLLTGTPLQNNVEELFSLLNFLEPKTFSCSQAFMAEFGDLRTESQVDKLKAILKPMMLRRLKEDVEKNLAPKEETIVEVELTNIQKKYYRAILERNFTFLAKGAGSSTNVPNLMNTMMELRKCCNHPYLIKGAEEKILEEVKERHGNETEAAFNALVQSCGKLVLIDKLLPKLQQDGHKILIFSQMIRVLDILEDYCLHRKYMYERLDGRIRGNIRQEAIDRFSKPESDRFVFLLCTRAGGLGINLTAADTVIIFDSDWNPQNDLQAQARCHRIGQSRSVKVYRLITRNTYEREMFDKASLKLGLDKAVLQSMGTDKNTQAGGNAMSKKDVEELLRKGAYGALMEDDSAGDKFCEEDIEQILQRRTQVIQIESEGKGSTFAKASFSAAGNRSDISIDDPNFWQKWAKKADLDVDELTNRNDLIIEEPRQRRQTTRYGNQDNVVDMSDLESSSDTDEEGGVPGKGGKRGKKRRNQEPKDDDFEAPEEGNGGRYTRAECFRVEKNLLVYGWGRWSDILAHGRFKRKLSEADVETISRALLAYSLQFYKGDERIKNFITDLVSPDNDEALKNHSGLSAPVPRGRKGKKLKKDSKHSNAQSDLDNSILPTNFEDILTDSGYKRHLQRHSNKVLLRVRLLYYLKQEVIGHEAKKVFMGYPSCDIDIPPPSCDGDPPAFWWDEESDRSLLVGVFKHGYEKYNLMRQDPCLVFLSRCGPPDGAAVLAEQNDEENDDFLDGRGRDDDDEDDMGDATPKKSATPLIPPDQIGEGGCLPFPSISELNTRLRRVVTGYQRNHKKAQMRIAQKAKRMERREKTELTIKEKELKKRESQQHRWSRREEADFYKTVSTFGVEMHKGRYVWDKFRRLARLDKKYDETLTEYFLAFYHMCKAVCKKYRDDEDASPPNNIYVEPITEERANRCLNRIDLLSRIRGEILRHPKLDERLKLCQPSFDMPEWWICGKHDKDLLIGAARHGVARTDYHILHDPALCFQEVIQCKTSQLYAAKPALRSSKPDTPSMKGDDGEEDFSEQPPPLLTKEGSPERPAKTEHEDEPENLSIVKKDDDMEVDISAVKNETDEEELKSELKSEEIDSNEKNSKDSKPTSPKNDIDSSESAKAECKSPVKELCKSVVDEKDDSACSKVNGEIDESEKSSEMEGKLVIDMSIDSKKEDSQNDSQESEKAPENSQENSDENPEGKTPAEETSKTDEAKDEVKAEVKTENEELKDNVKIENPDDLSSSRLTPSQEVSQHFGFGELDGLEGLGKEATVAELLARSVHNSSIQWPKDKVIFHRLEHVCYCVEHSEWPLVKRSYLLAGGDSRSATPVGASTPKSESLAGGDSLSDAPDSAVEGFKNDGLKMTFQKRRRRRKLEIEEERARLQQLMNQNAMSSDGESQGEIHNYNSTSRNESSAEKLVNGSGQRMEEAMMAQAFAQARAQAQAEAQARIQAAQAAAHAHALAQAQARYLGIEPVKKRRGRKRKADKIAELEAAARAAAMIEAERQAKRQAMEAAFNSDVHVPVINLEDGSRLSGKDAPRLQELEKWLEEHPGYMRERTDMEEEYLQFHMQEALGKRRGRRPRVDPAKLTADSLTGDENVSVINRETGKRITGAKAPPLKYLAEWLQQNPLFDVDPKWALLVRAKGNLPKSMEARVLIPSERRRRSKDFGYSSGMMGEFPFSMMPGMGGLSAANLANAGLLANFPKLPLNVPFGALPNLSMANPMLGLGGFGLPGIPVSSAAAAVASMSEAASADDDGKKRKESKSNETESKSPSKSPSSSVPTPHPSFPFMYNPLMYSPLFAAQGLRNFTLPSNLPTSFASLAQAGLSNGVPDAEQEEEGEVQYYEDGAQNEAQDLSVRHSKDKKTVREKLEELRARQKQKERHNQDKVEKKRTRVSDIVQDLALKKCATSPEKPEDLTVKPKEPKHHHIIDKSSKSKVEGKLERLVAKLKAVDKTKGSPSTATSSSSLPSSHHTAVSPTNSQNSEKNPTSPSGKTETSDLRDNKGGDSEQELTVSNSEGKVETAEHSSEDTNKDNPNSSS